MDHLCYLCLLFVMLSHLFIATLWSPEGKGLTSLLLFVMFIVILLLSHVVSWDECGTSFYTTLTNFSTKYLTMCKVYTDVGGIKQLYHVCPPVRKIIHSLKLADYLHVQADNPWYNYNVSITNSCCLSYLVSFTVLINTSSPMTTQSS